MSHIYELLQELFSDVAEKSGSSGHQHIDKDDDSSDEEDYENNSYGKSENDLELMGVNSFVSHNTHVFVGCVKLVGSNSSNNSIRVSILNDSTEAKFRSKLRLDRKELINQNILQFEECRKMGKIWNPYRFRYQNFKEEMNNKSFYMDLSKIFKIEKGRKNELVFHYLSGLRRFRNYVSIQFRYKRDVEFLLSFLSRILEYNKDVGEEIEGEEENENENEKDDEKLACVDGHSNRILNANDMYEWKLFGLVRGNVIEKYRLIGKPFKAWTRTEFEIFLGGIIHKKKIVVEREKPSWFNQRKIIEEQRKMVLVSVKDELKEKGYLESLINYVYSSKNKPKSLNEFCSLLMGVNKLGDLLDAKENVKYVDMIGTSLYRYLTLLKNFGNEIHSVPFQNVLVKKLEKERRSINDIMESLKGEEMYLWDVDECRDYLLSLLLFKKKLGGVQCKRFMGRRSTSLDDYVEKFTVFSKKRCKNSKELLIRFSEVLSSFYEEIGFRLEDVAYDFHIYTKRQNYLQVNYAKAIQKLQKDIEKFEVVDREVLAKKGEEWRKKMEEYLEKCIENEGGKWLKLFNDAEEKVKEYEKKLGIVDKKIEERRDFETQLREIENIIDEFHKGLRDDHIDIPFVWDFLRTNQRRKELKKLFFIHIGKVQDKIGILEVVCKLVLAELQNYDEIQIKGENRVLSIVNPWLKPEFFRFGYLHASVMMQNVQLHWYSNELVTIKELKERDDYSEFFCCDCFVPVTVETEEYYNMIHYLATEIVRWNTHTPYRAWTFAKTNTKKYSSGKNCQQFCLSILKCLRSTSFPPFVDAYLQDITKKLERNLMMGMEVGNLRYFDLSWDTEFEDTFSKINEEFQVEGKITFETHGNLDRYYRKIKEIDMNFEGNFSGVFQLLKSFDRAFFVLMKKDPQNQTYLPDEADCPFCKREEKKE